MRESSGENVAEPIRSVCPLSTNKMSPIRDVPDMGRAIDQGRHEAPAIVREGRSDHLIVMLELHGLASRGHLPHTGGPVGRGSHSVAAVR